MTTINVSCRKPTGTIPGPMRLSDRCLTRLDRAFLSLIAVLSLQTAMAQQGTPLPGKPDKAAVPTIDLKSAIEHARANSQQLQSAILNTALAREDRLQAKAGLFPTLNLGNQYIYTEGNGTPSGVYVSNDGVHVYNSQGNIHQDLLSVTRVVEYRRTILAQAISEAKAQVLARGITAAVVQNYYALVVAQRRFSNATRSLDEAQRFVDITAQLEKGGEVARADVVKAQIVLQQRRRDLQDAQLAIEKARIGLSVLMFPDLKLDFAVADDLNSPDSLSPIEELLPQAIERSPDLHAAQMTLQQESLGIKAARSGYLPSLSLDYWYGINANQFSTWSGDRQNLGSAAQASLVIPVWNWGATQSKVRQAEFRWRQAQLDLSLTQKQVLSELNSLYADARTALAELDSLRASVDLAAESLRLTTFRYQAGEASVLEVVDAQSTVTQARNAYDDGLSRLKVAFSSLQSLTGNL